MFNFPLENKYFTGRQDWPTRPKDAKTLCFAPSGLNSKWRYLFGANTFHDVIGYLCAHRQLPVKLAYSRLRDESKPATSLKAFCNTLQIYIMDHLELFVECIVIKWVWGQRSFCQPRGKNCYPRALGRGQLLLSSGWQNDRCPNYTFDDYFITPI